MKVFVLFVLVFCSRSSFQQLNRQQNQIQSLTYSQADYNPLPPISRTTTTTEEPETTTKKKGFFSGFTGLFKSKDKETTTQEPSTTKKASVSVTTTTKTPTVISTSTVKSIPTNPPVVLVSTPKVPPRSESPVSTPKVPPRPESLTPSTPKLQQPNPQIVSTTPKVPPRSEYPALPSKPGPSQVSSTTTSPKKTTKDDFPPLPSQPNRQQPTATPTASPSLPNAWGKPPGVAGPTQKPLSFFPQVPSNPSTKKPQVGSQNPTVNSGPVTDAELLTLSESLFSKDIYNAFKYVTVNYQGRTQSSAKTDEASQPLLKIDDKLFTQSTVEKMKLMYNNYEQDAAINEYVSPNEKKEEDDFIDAVLATPVMRHAMNFLTQKGIVTADPQTHRELLKTIWFNLYSRGMGKIGSSGFEHVFLSEVKNGTVMGLHNWIYLSEAEKSGDLDYQGWTKKIDLGNKGQIAKIRFTLNKLEKPSNSLFIGTSPELELALYTVCFELRADQECRLAYGGKDFNIVTHSYRYRGKNLIGSAYPEI